MKPMQPTSVYIMSSSTRDAEFAKLIDARRDQLGMNMSYYIMYCIKVDLGLWLRKD